MENQIVMLFLALGLLASLYFSLQIKMEFRRSDLNWRKEMEQVRFQLNEHRSNWIQAVRKEDAVLTPQGPLRAEVSFPARTRLAAPGIWGGPTKAKAIEMVRRGETSTKISAALSVPKPEVEFLMKLEQAAVKR
jgi:hypothetical protein